MAETTIAQEARELSRRLPADDARFRKLADLLKRYVAEEGRYAQAIDAWPNAAGAVEVAAAWVGSQSGSDPALQPFAKRAEAFCAAAGAVADAADAVLKGKSPAKFSSFADGFQAFCAEIARVQPDVAKGFQKRLVEYVTAERAAVDAARRWRMRLEQIAGEGRAVVAALAKETDRELIQTRKFIEARLVNVPKERMAALAAIGG